MRPCARETKVYIVVALPHMHLFLIAPVGTDASANAVINCNATKGSPHIQEARCIIYLPAASRTEKSVVVRVEFDIPQAKRMIFMVST